MRRNWLLAVLSGGRLFGGAIWYRRKKRRDSAWSIDNSFEEVAQAHAEYLRARHPAFHQKLANLLIADREAALGEAAVFSFLQTYVRVRPAPTAGTGTG